jgi:hypothetical protein
LFWSRKPTELTSFQTQLDDLRRRVGTLEELSWDGRVQQLAALDKVLGKLNDRVRKKLERETSSEDAPGPTIDDEEVSHYPPPRPSTAHLARRFRGG